MLAPHRVVSLLTVALGLVVVAVAATASGGSVSRTARTKPVEREISVLYVVSAGGGTLAREAGGRYRLRLRGVARQALMFADRPSRFTSALPVAGLVASWRALGFAKVPPNAALTLLDGRPGRDTVLLELTQPRWGPSPGALSFLARPLDRPSHNLGHLGRRVTGTLPRAFRTATLFLDDATGTTVNGCYIGPWTTCDKASLQNVDLSGSTLTNASFAGANLSNANLSSATLTSASFAGATLSGATLDHARAHSAIFDNASMESVIANAADFTGASFNGTDAALGSYTDAIFSKAALTGASFLGAYMGGASFTGATIDATFATGILRGADFSNASADGSGFYQANARGAKFENASLFNINLSGADVTGASFDGSNLSQAYLQGATGFNPGTAKLCNTQLPDASIANGGC